MNLRPHGPVCPRFNSGGLGWSPLNALARLCPEYVATESNLSARIESGSCKEYSQFDWCVVVISRDEPLLLLS